MQLNYWNKQNWTRNFQKYLRTIRKTMVRNPEKNAEFQKKPRYQKKNSKEDIEKAVETSKTLTQEAARKAIEAIISSTNIDLTEGGSNMPASYSTFLNQGIPPQVYPNAIQMQTPLNKQNLS